MSNLTLRVEDDVLKAVRRYAVEKETSVNRLVREFLAGIAERESRAQEVQRRMRELSEHSSARIGEKSWSRDDLHVR
jgi:hypothetical protein